VNIGLAVAFNENAGKYGMNFKGIPELDWPYGYPFALCLMVASVAAPFIYFRRKGWLR
jgi:magnesium transporter